MRDVNWRFGLEVSSMLLWNGKRSWYVALKTGRWTWWLQRWDAGRCWQGARTPRLRERIRLLPPDRMAWTWGWR